MSSSATPRDHVYSPPWYILNNYQLIGTGMGLVTHSSLKRFKASVNYKTLPLFVLGGIFFGTFVNNQVEKFTRKRMLEVERYIETHPETCKQLPPEKYKDLFVDWHPLR